MADPLRFLGLALAGCVTCSVSSASTQPFYLEKFATDELSVWNAFARHDGKGDYVIVLDPERLAHRVELGDPVGNRRGRVRAISGCRVDLIELEPDGNGGWNEVPTTLPIGDGCIRHVGNHGRSAIQPIGVGIGVRCDDPGRLDVAVHNPSDRPVTMDEGALPWNDTSSMRLEGYLLQDGVSTHLQTYGLVADYFDTVVLDPKATLQGSVGLQSVFGMEFEDFHAAGDILVYYEVAGRYVGADVQLHARSGVILIPRKRLFSSACPTILRRGRE